MNNAIYRKTVQSVSKKPDVRLALSVKKAENYCKLNCTARTKAQNLGGNAHGKDKVVFKNLVFKPLVNTFICSVLFEEL